jgi:hypothetical protein
MHVLITFKKLLGPLLAIEIWRITEIVHGVGSTLALQMTLFGKQRQSTI